MKNPRRSVLFLLWWVSMACICAQPGKQDSLATAIQALPNDSTKVVRLLELAATLTRTAPPDAFRYAEEALGIAEDLENPTGMARAHYLLGTATMRMGQMEDALDNYSQALRICNRFALKPPKADVLRGMGNLFLDQGDIDVAESYFLQSIAIAREIGDSLGTAKSLNNLGGIAGQRGNRQAAIEYFLRAAPIFEAANQVAPLSTCYTNISGQYTLLKQFGPAVEYCNKALAINQNLKDTRSMSAIYERLQMIYREQGQYDMALQNGLRALELVRQVDKGVALGNVLRSVGATCLQQTRYKAALPYVEEAITVYQGINNIGMQSQTTYDLARILTYIPDLPRALRTANDALNLARMGEEYGLMAACESLSGEIYVRLSDDPQALERLLRAKSLVETHPLPKQEFADVYRLLAELYARQGQAGKAKEMQNLYDSLAPAPNTN